MPISPFHNLSMYIQLMVVAENYPTVKFPVKIYSTSLQWVKQKFKVEDIGLIILTGCKQHLWKSPSNLCLNCESRLSNDWSFISLFRPYLTLVQTDLNPLRGRLRCCLWSTFMASLFKMHGLLCYRQLRGHANRH